MKQKRWWWVSDGYCFKPPERARGLVPRRGRTRPPAQFGASTNLFAPVVTNSSLASQMNCDWSTSEQRDRCFCAHRIPSRRIWRRGSRKCRSESSYAHALNLCEVYYDLFRASNRDTAEAAISDLLGLGIEERTDMDAEFLENGPKYQSGAPQSLSCRLLRPRAGAPPWGPPGLGPIGTSSNQFSRPASAKSSSFADNQRSNLP